MSATPNKHSYRVARDGYFKFYFNLALLRRWLQRVADGRGFEPRVPFGTHAFQACTIDRSVTHPLGSTSVRSNNQSCSRWNNSSSGSWMPMKNSPKSAYSALTGSKRIL